MKIILTFMFIITLSLDLFGRMNPFEPTDTFNDKKSEYYKIEKLTNEDTKVSSDLTNQEKETFKILPFVNVEVVNDKLIIKVNKKYKLLNQDILKEQKKLLFDFQGNVSFYTVRKSINHKDFKSFAIGTHRQNNFFRVVVDLPENLVKYKEVINSKKGIITIQKIK